MLNPEFIIKLFFRRNLFNYFSRFLFLLNLSCTLVIVAKPADDPRRHYSRLLHYRSSLLILYFDSRILYTNLSNSILQDPSGPELPLARSEKSTSRRYGTTKPPLPLYLFHLPSKWCHFTFL